MKKIEYTIRKIHQSEHNLLKTFLYEAIFQPDETDLLPRDIINKPELQIYIKNFGNNSDLCLVAEDNTEIIACVWTRILAGEIKGFGNIDDKTPEFAISVLKKYRGLGIGSSLMRAMLGLLKEKGYEKTSLAVQKENYAVQMYKKFGFEIINEKGDEYIMLCIL